MIQLLNNAQSPANGIITGTTISQDFPTTVTGITTAPQSNKRKISEDLAQKSMMIKTSGLESAGAPPEIKSINDVIRTIEAMGTMLLLTGNDDKSLELAQLLMNTLNNRSTPDEKDFPIRRSDMVSSSLIGGGNSKSFEQALRAAGPDFVQPFLDWYTTSQTVPTDSSNRQ